MTCFLETSDHFKTVIAQDLCGMLLGECLGYGTHRAVFHHATDPTLVVKVEPHERTFRNVYEHEVWSVVKDTEFAKWFAPVEHISENGRILLMKRCDREADVCDLPKQVPAFFTDLKAENWGKLGKRFVCLDYGNNLFIEYGMTKRMRNANWTKHG